MLRRTALGRTDASDAGTPRQRPPSRLKAGPILVGHIHGLSQLVNFSLPDFSKRLPTTAALVLHRDP